MEKAMNGPQGRIWGQTRQRPQSWLQCSLGDGDGEVGNPEYPKKTHKWKVGAPVALNFE